MLEFHQKLAVPNRARLVVDGTEVDKTNVVSGGRELNATPADEVPVTSPQRWLIPLPQVRSASATTTS